MFIAFNKVANADFVHNTRGRTVAVLRCDQCQINFTRSTNVKRVSQITNHYCSRRCLQASHARGNKAYTSAHATMRQRYGIDYASSIAKKAHDSLTEETIVKSVEKTRQTCLSKYSVEFPCQLPHVRKLCLEAARTDEVQLKREATTLDRYGYRTALEVPAIHALCNLPDAQSKRHLTMKANRSYRKSRPEDAFHQWLVSKFGPNDIERPKPVYRWLIDFYIRSLDTYVELDGEYWHGLDRPLEEIALHRTPRDVFIHKRRLNNLLQDEWFLNRGLKLMRITDKQFHRGEHVHVF